MFRAIGKLIGVTDSFWHKLFGNLSAFSKAMILSGMIACGVLTLAGFGAEIYCALTENTSYIIHCVHLLTEGGFRCLLLGGLGSAVYEYIRLR